jgi:hypothetical protein
MRTAAGPEHVGAALASHRGGRQLQTPTFLSE